MKAVTAPHPLAALYATHWRNRASGVVAMVTAVPGLPRPTMLSTGAIDWPQTGEPATEFFLWDVERDARHHIEGEPGPHLVPDLAALRRDWERVEQRKVWVVVPDEGPAS
jgi:hypothetical protein